MKGGELCITPSLYVGFIAYSHLSEGWGGLGKVEKKS